MFFGGLKPLVVSVARRMAHTASVAFVSCQRHRRPSRPAILSTAADSRAEMSQSARAAQQQPLRLPLSAELGLLGRHSQADRTRASRFSECNSMMLDRAEGTSASSATAPLGPLGTAASWAAPMLRCDSRGAMDADESAVRHASAVRTVHRLRTHPSFQGSGFGIALRLKRSSTVGHSECETCPTGGAAAGDSSCWVSRPPHGAEPTPRTASRRAASATPFFGKMCDVLRVERPPSASVTPGLQLTDADGAVNPVRGSNTPVGEGCVGMTKGKEQRGAPALSSVKQSGRGGPASFTKCSAALQESDRGHKVSAGGGTLRCGGGGACDNEAPREERPTALRDGAGSRRSALAVRRGAQASAIGRATTWSAGAKLCEAHAPARQGGRVGTSGATDASGGTTLHTSLRADCGERSAPKQRLAKARPQSSSRRRLMGFSTSAARGGSAPQAPQDPYYEAAVALLNADFLLICAGAGFSADSGLATYKDVADVAAYRDRDLEYSDLCTPQWLQKDPRTFFGFWGSCFNSYHRTEPHEGYTIVAKWRDFIRGKSEHPLTPAGTSSASRGKRSSIGTSVCPHELAVPSLAGCLDTTPGSCTVREKENLESHQSIGTKEQDAQESQEENLDGSISVDGALKSPSCSTAHDDVLPEKSSFVFTSNVDGFFRRSGWDESSILEIHGNISRWQCSLPCPASRIACHDPSPNMQPIWTLPSSHRFDVDLETMLAPPNKVEPPPTPSTDMSAPEAFATHAPVPNYQRCPFCNRLARPCILMFDDLAWLGDRGPGPLGHKHSQPQTYRMWEAAVKEALGTDPGKRLVILEAGCGLRVPTVRRHSQRLLRETSQFGTLLVRINPESPFNRKGRDATISIKDSCLNAVQRIDAHLSALRSAVEKN